MSEENSQCVISTVLLDGPEGPVGHVKIYTFSKCAEQLAYYDKDAQKIWSIKPNSDGEMELSWARCSAKARALHHEISSTPGDFESCLGIIYLSHYSDEDLLASFNSFAAKEDLNFQVIAYPDAGAVSSFVERTLEFHCPNWVRKKQ